MPFGIGIPTDVGVAWHSCRGCGLQPSRPPKTSLGWEDGCDEEAFPKRPTPDVRIADIHARADSRSTNCGNLRISDSEILQATGSAKDSPSRPRHSKTFAGIHAGLSEMSVLAFPIATQTINLHQVDKHTRPILVTADGRRIGPRLAVNLNRPMCYSISQCSMTRCLLWMMCWLR